MTDASRIPFAPTTPDDWTGDALSVSDALDELAGSAGGGSGDVVGPASATNRGIPQFNGTTGKLLASTAATVDTAGNISVGNITTSGTVDGRDLAADGSKLDGIETAADVTDAANVAAAGAIMDSDVSGKAGAISTDGAGTYGIRQITAGDGIGVTNGDFSGDLTISLATSADLVQTWGSTSSSSTTLPLRPTVSNVGTGIDGWYMFTIPFDLDVHYMTIAVQMTSYTSGEMKIEVNRNPLVGSNAVVIDQDTSGIGPTSTNHEESWDYSGSPYSFSANDRIAVVLKPSNGSMTIVDPVVCLWFKEP